MTLSPLPTSSYFRAGVSADPVATDGPHGYEILELAGEGAFSEVWRVRNRATGVQFALKRLRAEWQDEPTARQLLRNESEVCQAVSSRHVVRAFDGGQWRGSPFVILDWLPGTRLQEILQSRGRLPVGEAVWIARQCAVGLADLERAGFSHGDVKPQNIVVAAAGESTLVDLGFACPIHPTPARDRNGALTGTPEYMPPESLSPAPVRPVLKDMYSLGVALYRMLSGRLPFVGNTAAEVLQKHRSMRPPLLRLQCPEAPRPLADLVSRLLAKQPIRRPPTFSALIRELIRIEVEFLPQRFVN